MELLPIIYNSLLIAAGLFVITIAISYVSYKVKQNKGSLDAQEEIQYKSVFKDKKRIEEELKPHHRTQYSKSSRSQKSERKPEKRDVKREKPRPKSERPKKKEDEHQRKPERGATERIEIVRDLVSKDKADIPKERKTSNRVKKEDEDKSKKKNLKSIDNDPLNKYTDSADDDLHPLKTDE